MKKRNVVIGWMCGILMLGGCQQPPGTQFYKMNAPTKQTHTIEEFELEKYRTQPQPEIPSVLELPEEPLEKLDLALDQCRALALENNLDLKVQLMNPTIEQEDINFERAQFEPFFSSNFIYNKTDQPVAETLDITGSQRDYSYVDLGVDIPLLTGGNIAFNLADSRTKTNSEFSVFNPYYVTGTSVSISQPLLRGAGIRTNTHAIRIAEYDKYSVDAQTKLEIIAVIGAMDRVYWRLYAAYQLLQVRLQQYELAEAQLQRAQRFVEAGQQAQIEVNRAEAGLAQSLESIILAQNELQDRQRELKRVLNKPGLELGGPTAIVPATQPNPVHYTFQTDNLLEMAIDKRMELLQLELQIASSISSIHYLRNQALPVVNLDYTYNINGLGPTRSDAYDLLQDNNFADHRIGLNLLIPLGNKAAESLLRQAYTRRIQLLASKENRRRMIEVEVLDAVDQLESNWQRILAARQNTILQERLYQAEIRQFENGLTTSTDVLEAQTNFADAQSTEINALAEYQIALVDLAVATGTLPGAANIIWEPVRPLTD